jgi:hypothetical protein
MPVLDGGPLICAFLVSGANQVGQQWVEKPLREAI